MSLIRCKFLFSAGIGHINAETSDGEAVCILYLICTISVGVHYDWWVPRVPFLYPFCMGSIQNRYRKHTERIQNAWANRMESIYKPVTIPHECALPNQYKGLS